MKNIKKYLEINKKIWITVLIATGLFVVTSSIIENSSINTNIENFKQKGVYQESFSNINTKFFIVPRETLDDYQPSFYITESNKLLPGRTGDILTDRQSSFQQIPFVNEFITTFVGGHAAIVAPEYKDNNISSTEGEFIESTGLSDDNLNVAQISINGIRDISGGRNTTVGLRVKTSLENKRVAATNALSFVGNPYNYSFIFETNIKNYCTDLVTKSYLPLGINLNYDLGPTTVQDIDMSSNVYIFYYKYKDSNNVTNIYYLDDLNNKQDISGTIF